MKQRLLCAFIIAACIQVAWAGPCSAREEWLSSESNCCTIRYRDNGHLTTFTRRIGGFRYTSQGLDQNPSNSAVRVDEIMIKVQTILDMHPPDMRITIELYPDYESVGTVFRQFSVSGNVPLAFYAHRSRTIYVDTESVTDGVLAHEIAHAVINFYFKTPPPAKMKEILAQYVDLHIWD